MNAKLPLATTWFHSTQITDTITRIEEPHVHEMVRANVWHIRGSDHDLIVDAGLASTRSVTTCRNSFSIPPS